MSERFKISNTSLQGLKLIQRKPLGDKRGYLERMFCSDELADILGENDITQINRTLTSKQGTVRGLHFQHKPHSEMKFVSCLQGKVFDVAIDIRKGSPTFLKWHAEILSDDNHKTFFIPGGFAHGFQSLQDNTVLLYFHTAAYQSDAEDALNPLDSKLNIAWPQPVNKKEMSIRDREHPMLTKEFRGIEI